MEINYFRFQSRQRQRDIPVRSLNRSIVKYTEVNVLQAFRNFSPLSVFWLLFHNQVEKSPGSYPRMQRL